MKIFFKTKTGLTAEEKKQSREALECLLRKNQFGHFAQGQGGNTEPIFWQEIIRSANDITYISKKILTVRRFHKNGGSTGWERSELRKWLNTRFLRESFSKTERLLLQPILLSGHMSDKISLLGFEDAKRLEQGLIIEDIEIISTPRLPGNPIAYGPAYPPYGNSETARNYFTNTWWLRTDAHDDPGSAMAVYLHGAIHKKGYNKNLAECGVRPIIKVPAEVF